MAKKVKSVIKRVLIEMGRNEMLQWGYNEEK